MFLGGDSFRGRLTNTPENNLALEWVASRFEAFGLKGAGAGGSYFQPYNLITATLGDVNELEIASGGATIRHSTGSDFYPHRHSVSGRVSAPVAFSGYGIIASALGYDDPRETCKERSCSCSITSLVERSASAFDGLVTSEYSNQLRRRSQLQEKGAAGVLFVSDVHAHPGRKLRCQRRASIGLPRQPRMERYLLARGRRRCAFRPSDSIALAEALVRGSGKTFAGARARRGQPPRQCCDYAPLGVTATW